MIRGTMVSTWKMSFDGLTSGAGLLSGREPVYKAVLAAVKAVEDNPAYVSVGYGGLPNIDGEVELDAAYMNGDTLGFGGVISAKDIKNPIEVAYDLSHYQRNSLLAGRGTVLYARQKGYEMKNMLTRDSRERYEKTDKQVDTELLEAYQGHDTVCVIGKDYKGSMACGVSTSGLFMKRPGRVGDSPLIGSGLYADSEVGCAAATGVGEDIMKGCLSYAVVGLMQQGMEVQAACDEALGRHLSRLGRNGYEPGSISVIAMDAQGRVGSSTNMEEFPFVVADENGQCHIYVSANYGGKYTVFKADEEWLNHYAGD